MGKVKVILKKSLIASKPNQRATAESLGLKKVGDSVIHDDNNVLGGKIRVLAHLVEVEKAD